MSVDHSAIGRRAKGKGSSYERRVAKFLMELTGVNFRKTPASGGFGKQGVVVAEHAFTGDIISDRSDFQFSVECKNRANDFSFAQILSVPDKAPFTIWWHQTVEDAKSVDLMPIMFFKAAKSATQTVGSDYVALDKDGMELLKYPEDKPRIVFDIYREPIDITIREGKKVSVLQNLVLPTAYIVGWRQIVEYVEPQRFFKVQ